MINQRIKMDRHATHVARDDCRRLWHPLRWLFWLGAFAWQNEWGFAQPTDDESIFYGLVKTNARLENRIMQTATCLVTLDNSTELKTWPCHAATLKDFLARRIFCDRLLLENGNALPLINDSYFQSITHFLNQGGSPNSWVAGGEPLLTSVARADDVPSIQALLKTGANVHALDLRWERTALLATAETGAIHAAKTLLAAGANPHSTNVLDWNLADSAAIAEQPHFIDQLIHMGSLPHPIARTMASARNLFLSHESQIFVDAGAAFTREHLFQEVDAFLNQTASPRFAASFWVNEAVLARRPDFVRYLLEKHGANPHLVLDNQGPSILFALSQNRLREAAVLAEYDTLEHLEPAQRVSAEKMLARFLNNTPLSNTAIYETAASAWPSNADMGWMVLGFFLISLMGWLIYQKWPTSQQTALTNNTQSEIPRARRKEIPREKPVPNNTESSTIEKQMLHHTTVTHTTIPAPLRSEANKSYQPDLKSLWADHTDYPLEFIRVPAETQHAIETARRRSKHDDRPIPTPPLDPIVAFAKESKRIHARYECEIQRALEKKAAAERAVEAERARIIAQEAIPADLHSEATAHISTSYAEAFFLLQGYSPANLPMDNFQSKIIFYAEYCRILKFFETELRAGNMGFRWFRNALAHPQFSLSDPRAWQLVHDFHTRLFTPSFDIQPDLQKGRTLFHSVRQSPLYHYLEACQQDWHRNQNPAEKLNLKLHALKTELESLLEYAQDSKTRATEQSEAWMAIRGVLNGLYEVARCLERTEIVECLRSVRNRIAHRPAFSIYQAKMPGCFSIQPDVTEEMLFEKIRELCIIFQTEKNAQLKQRSAFLA